MAGSLHPPFVSGLSAAALRRLASDTRLWAQSLFPSKRKRENGPCTVQKRKRSTPCGGTGDEGRARGSDGFLRMSPVRGVVRAGVWCLSNGLSLLSAAAALALASELRHKLCHELRPEADAGVEAFLCLLSASASILGISVSSTTLSTTRSWMLIFSSSAIFGSPRLESTSRGGSLS